jgi:SPP1 family predicted phage head-tail adaptor
MQCCNLSPGKLRHVVQLESQSGTADGGGGIAITWPAYATGVSALLKPANGTERRFADRLEANITHVAWIRYRTDVQAKHRLLYAGRTMQIRAVLNLEERNRWLELHLEEGVAT